MGGRVRLMMSGGAPLSPDTHEQIETCLCVNLIQGYGLTETTSGATVMDCMNENNVLMLLNYFIKCSYTYVVSYSA